MTSLDPRLTTGSPLSRRQGNIAAQIAPAEDKIPGTTLSKDRVSLSPGESLEAGTSEALTALGQAGVEAERLNALEIRGLGGLVAAGLVPGPALVRVAKAAAADSSGIGRTLAEYRPAYMKQLEQRYGIELADGSSRWTVQELANLDWVLSQISASFKLIVLEGGPFTREVANAAYSGLYNPFKDRIFYPDNMNPGGKTLDEVKASERYMRSVMVHEMAHAWQIRQTSHLNPGVGGVLKALRGVLFREHDRVSEWSAVAGWTVKSKWSLPDWLSKPHLPNSSNASYQLARLELSAFGRNKTFNLTNLKLDPAKEGNLISDYAKTDPYEDFAESVAAYVVDSAELRRRAPEKYAYIKDRVMSGQEYANRYGIYP